MKENHFWPWFTNKSSPGFVATGFFKIPWHLPDSIHISLTKHNNKSVNDRFYRAFLKISDPWQKWWCQQNNVKSIFEKVLIWENLCLDLANWSIYMVTGESCCLKWSFSLTLCEIPWHFSSILPNVKISLTLCKNPRQFPDLEKFYFFLTFPWRLWTLQSENAQGPLVRNTKHVKMHYWIIKYIFHEHLYCFFQYHLQICPTYTFVQKSNDSRKHFWVNVHTVEREMDKQTSPYQNMSCLKMGTEKESAWLNNSSNGIHNFKILPW